MAERSEAQKRAARAYWEKNREALAGARKQITVAVPTETAEAFKAACYERGSTPNGVLNQMIRDYLGE